MMHAGSCRKTVSVELYPKGEELLNCIRFSFEGQRLPSVEHASMRVVAKISRKMCLRSAGEVPDK